MRSGVVLLLAVAVLAAVCDAAQKPIKPREPKFGLGTPPTFAITLLVDSSTPL